MVDGNEGRTLSQIRARKRRQGEAVRRYVFEGGMTVAEAARRMRVDETVVRNVWDRLLYEQREAVLRELRYLRDEKVLSDPRVIARAAQYAGVSKHVAAEVLEGAVAAFCAGEADPVAVLGARRSVMERWFDDARHWFGYAEPPEGVGGWMFRGDAA